MLTVWAQRTLRHEFVSWALLLETALVQVALSAGALLLGRHLLTSGGPLLRWLLLLPLTLLQGVWLDRLYAVGHEAVHRKLFPRSPRANDLCGALILAPLLAPLSLFRKIHGFHHGQNRRDPQTAALDSFVSSRPMSPARRLYYRASWIFLVFLGGFFVHTLISIALFLFVPTATAQRISPVFRGFGAAQRVRAWLELLLAVTLHLGVAWLLGGAGWALVLGLPLIVFAWLWSMLLYVYHYDTTLGDGVRWNVRSLPPQPLLSWVLLHFNEHATHHDDPRLPWYQLPAARRPLPPEYRGNDNVQTLGQAVRQQWRGPLLWERQVSEPPASGPPQFRRLEPR